MIKDKPIQHICQSDCLYRYQTDGLCTFGEKNIPHPENGHACLYQVGMKEIPKNVNYLEIARHKWNLNPEPPPKVQRLLKIVAKPSISYKFAQYTSIMRILAKVRIIQIV